MQTQSPFSRLWELGKSEHGGLTCAMISAAAGLVGYALRASLYAPKNISFCYHADDVTSGREEAVGWRLNAQTYKITLSCQG